MFDGGKVLDTVVTATLIYLAVPGSIMVPIIIVGWIVKQKGGK